MTQMADELFSTPEMARVWSGAALVRHMLAFEAALARAEARAGVIPLAAAEAIAAACAAPETFDAAAILREAALAGTPAIPLVRLLTERVPDVARDFVHWGATSQDALDTALVAQLLEGGALLLADLRALGTVCADLAERHRQTLMAGRTLLQQATPITFGLKAARWLALVTRQIARLREVCGRVAVVQFGGAAGTLAALGAHGPLVTELLAAELGLGVPDLPWHAERDRIAETGAALGVIAGSVAKIARDLVLLAQTEVGEAVAAPTAGKGGSSAMPQKHNPVDAAFALAAARLALGMVPALLDALVQEHERAAGAWQTEWAALPALFGYTAAAVARTRDALAELTVDAARMRANLDLGGGAIMAEALTQALAPHLGRQEARRLVRAASVAAARTGGDLKAAALANARIAAALPADEITRALDPAAYLGSNDAYIERALEGWRAQSA